MFLPRLSTFTMETLLFIGLLLINHSCVLGNGSSFGLYNRREQSSSHYQNFSEEDTINNDVPNEDTTVSSVLNNNNANDTGKGRCQLPGKWHGKYFQHSTEVEIDGNSISGKGVCQENQDDKYLFVLPEENGRLCYKCIIILQKHRNVLQYKESDCEDKNTLEYIYDTIPGDAQFQTLFRINGKPEECPFRGGPFKFSYSKGGRGACTTPESFIETCSESWRLSFHYQSCPTDPSSESKEEEVHCQAQWQEGSTKYLVGKLNSRYRDKLEDQYRCFVFEEIKSTERLTKRRGSPSREHDGITGYKIGISGDASCSGISSPTDGEVNLSLKKVFTEEKLCTFPEWMSSSEWNTLDGGKIIKLQENDTSFLVVERPNANSSRTELIFPALLTGNRVLCQERVNISQDQLAIVARITIGCKSEKICLHVYKRSEVIIEMHMVTQSHSEENFEEQCKNGSLAHVAGTSAPILTLVNSRAKTTACPFQGKFSVNGLTKYGEPVKNICSETEEGSKEELNGVSVACKHPESFDILSKCSVEDELQEFQCVDHWRDSDKGFLIVANSMLPISPQNPSYCCSYKESPLGYYVSVSKTSCGRNLFPSGEVLSTFNLTMEANCVEPKFEKSRAQIIHCDTVLMIQMLIFVTLPFVGVFLSSI